MWRIASLAAIAVAAGSFEAAAQDPFEERLLALPQGTGLKECDVCPELVAIPAGTFLMGSPDAEEGRDDGEGPQRRVTLQAFAIGAYEITFDEWDACVSDGYCRAVPVGGDYYSGDRSWGRGRRPAITVSWRDITGERVAERGFLAWLNEKVDGAPYRLPSEAEWEYAARAGTTGPFSFEGAITPERANYHGGVTYAGSPTGAYRQQPLPVGSFAPNPWGLYDVHGNVWEWVQDCWSESTPARRRTVRPERLMAA